MSYPTQVAVLLCTLVAITVVGGLIIRRALGLDPPQWEPGTCCGCGRTIGAGKTMCNDCSEGRR